ncbi:hypothetical protein [Nocardia sp. CC227C]|uniref:hypothetical protein n=1 Tax=Nocardia sp. CC227C TaxID=3044562 RepID=UPI00278BEAA5|nr:hypothetical protein [Nocardia sp. CC227C]
MRRQRARREVDDTTTRAITEMDIDPDRFVENVGDTLGVLDTAQRAMLVSLSGLPMV